ncbi:jg24348 [Pararge aegeria aegeria]|uniref:Jg24348 protein n=1 Tax=Pararge aegeria aegeria TaxID=348720 RepID=A0A8S4QV87_9NEOP|nr:jg24348 [Pararge aegeria aegeria]
MSLNIVFVARGALYIPRRHLASAHVGVVDFTPSHQTAASPMAGRAEAHHCASEAVDKNHPIDTDVPLSRLTFRYDARCHVEND